MNKLIRPNRLHWMSQVTETLHMTQRSCLGYLISQEYVCKLVINQKI